MTQLSVGFNLFEVDLIGLIINSWIEGRTNANSDVWIEDRIEDAVRYEKLTIGACQFKEED